MKLIQVAMLAGFVAVNAVFGCSPGAAKSAQKAGECGAIRDFYRLADKRVIDSGACDESPSITDCLPHLALREALVASLEKNECPSEQ